MAAGAGHPCAWSRTARFCNWSTLQLGIILQRNPSANPSAGDGCLSPVSPQESHHVTTALSHRSGAGSSPPQPLSLWRVWFHQAASCHRKRLMHNGFCTKRGFIAFTMGLGTRQHHLGLGRGAGEHPTSGSALCGTATHWVGRAGAGDLTAAQPKPRCTRLVPGWYLSRGRSQGTPGAANSLQGQVLGWLLSSGPDPALLIQLGLDGFPESPPAPPWTLQELHQPPAPLGKGVQHQPPDSILHWVRGHPPWWLCCPSPASSPPFLGHFNLVSDLSLVHTRPLGEGSAWLGLPEPHGLGLTGFIPV